VIIPVPPLSSCHPLQVWEGGGCTPSLTLAVGVPVCSVRYHPTTPHLLAVGSAKHAVLLYDLRAPATPLAALAGHAKAVSYVRWQEPSTSNTPPAAAAAAAAAEVAEEGGPQPMEVLGAAGEGEGGTAHGSSSSNGQAGTGSSAALVSASVDSTLRRWVWDPAAAGGGSSAPAPAAPTSPGAAGWRCERLFSGHTTTKAFTGLSVEGPYIATGSETNQVYLYHAAMSGPAATARLPLPGGGPGGGVGCTGDVFVSAVAWRRGSRVLLATNSAGGVYVLGLSG
jgi:WD40 repeat protein